MEIVLVADVVIVVYVVTLFLLLMHSLIVSNTWLIDGLFVCAALGTSSASMKMEMAWGGGYEIEKSLG